MVAWPDLPKEAREDCFAPPCDPVMVCCIHCGETYWSSEIRWQKDEGDDMGFWRCPVPECDGAGFRFDIWPLDSDGPGGGDFGDEDDEDWDDDEDDELDEDEEGEFDPDLFGDDDDEWDEEEDGDEEKPKGKGSAGDPFLNTDNDDMPF